MVSNAPAQAEWEQDLAEQVAANPAVPVTEKRKIILARRGQGKFRERVSVIERACRITGVNRPEHLIASHCKPWRDCESNDERLDGENGLLLTPTVDHHFDCGFTEGQRRYLEFHREAVFLEARVRG
ncbi:MAG: HNH endonuclease signature motif containing protein [Steroidobacteraceae bacterium]